jgi:hypothetical protein
MFIDFFLFFLLGNPSPISTLLLRYTGMCILDERREYISLDEAVYMSLVYQLTDETWNALLVPLWSKS